MTRTLSATYTSLVTLNGISDDPATITATGFLQGGLLAPVFASAWTLTNAGTVQNGVTLASFGTVANTGDIVGSSRSIVSGMIVDTKGVYLLAGGSVTNASAGVISGDQDTGVFVTGAAGTVNNAGSIAGVADGVRLNAGGTVTNISGGSISGYFGIQVAGNTGTVNNSGSIASLIEGVYLQAGGSVTNTSGGSIYGGGLGILARGAATIVNAGTVTSETVNGYGYGIELGPISTVINSVSGSIVGGKDGIAAAGTIINAGSISGSVDAVRFFYGYNNRLVIDPSASFSGTIDGGNTIGSATVSTLELASAATVGTLSIPFINFAQIQIDAGAAWNILSGNRVGSDVTLTNLGMINGFAMVSGSVVNAASGSIIGRGVDVYAGSGIISNAGTIGFDINAVGSGGGVYLDAGGTVTNAFGGVIVGTDEGIAVHGGLGTINNAGTITAFIQGVRLAAGPAFYPGVYLAGGAVFNAPLGMITGGSSGIYVSGGPGTVSNAGTIWGGADGITLSAGGTIYNEVGGTISGANGVYVSGGGTVINAGSIYGSADAVKFTALNANRLVIDPGASFTGTVDGGNTIGGGAVSTLEVAAGTSTISDIGSQFVNFAQVVIDAGGTLNVTGTISGGETITFVANSGAFAFDPTQFSGQIGGFRAGDTINLAAVTDATSATIVNTNTLEIARASYPAIDLTLDPGRDFSGSTFAVTSTGVLTTTATAPCFCPGTLIRTDRGEVTIETLAIGDRVITAAGAVRPIKWIGHRYMDLARHPAPRRAQPIRVRANAFAPGRPARDLCLSPEHAILRDGLLVPVRLLVNGASIQRENRRSVIYYHIELETHDILLAEGLEVESYLDTGNRGMFSNAPGPLLLHPDLTNDMLRRFAESCAPFADDPDRIEPMWRALAARAELINMPLPIKQETTTDPDLHLLADGRRLEPISASKHKQVFVVPDGVEHMRLMSRSAFRSDTSPWISDERRLGISLSGLTVRLGSEVKTIPLDHPALQDGWWQPDWHSPTILRRWTNGDAMLPMPDGETGVMLLEVDIGATVDYPLQDNDNQPTSMAPTGRESDVGRRSIGITVAG